MIHYDPTLALDIKNDADKQKIERAFLGMLKEWYVYKEQVRRGGANRNQKSCDPPSYDRLVMSITGPGLHASDTVEEYFQDIIEKLTTSQNIRRARDFNGLGYSQTECYEFTETGFQWNEKGASDQYDLDPSEYVAKIRTALHPSSAPDLQPGLEYLEEGHRALIHVTPPLLRSSAFMIGAASELLISKLYAELDANHHISPHPAGSISAKIDDTFNWLSVGGNVTILTRRAVTAGAEEKHTRSTIVDFRGTLGRIAHVIRMDRNHIGHPTPFTFTDQDLKGFLGEFRHFYTKGSEVLWIATL